MKSKAKQRCFCNFSEYIYAKTAYKCSSAHFEKHALAILQNMFTAQGAPLSVARDSAEHEQSRHAYIQSMQQAAGLSVQ